MRKRWLFCLVALRSLGSLITILTSPGPPEVSTLVQQEQDQPLRVVTKVIEPFVFIEQDRFSGFSIDLWKEIALIMNLPFEFVQVETVSEQLAYLEEGQAEIAIAAISMTPEREEVIDFPYPYYRSGVQIMTNNRSTRPISSLLTAFVSSRLLTVIGSLLFIMVVVAHPVWLAERKNNPDFPRRYWSGVWEGLWWSAVTITTVGYGDKRVNGIWGRLLGMFWMFSGIFLIANFTAMITTELTISEIQGAIESVKDLPGKEVATVAGTTSAEFLEAQRTPFRGLETIDEAYDLLDEGEIRAIVYDAPVLQYYASTADRDSVRLIDQIFKPEDYGIALTPDSPHKEDINRALLQIVESGIYQQITDEWFSAEE